MLQLLSLPAQWIVLMLLSAALTWGMEALRLPAALLLGPMAAGAAVSLLQGRVRLPEPLFLASQGTVGCLIATSITVPILLEIVTDWPIFLAGVTVVVGASALLGRLLARTRVLPGTTAVWGTWPGAATAMILMSQSYGGDMRLVAFMQYLRVAMVAGLASVVAALWTSGAGAGHAATVWFPEPHWARLAATLGLMALGSWVSEHYKVPAGGVLVTMFFAVLAQDVGGLEMELPPWLLAAGYACIGWGLGLRFTPEILRHAAKAMPKIVGSITCLIMACGLFGWVLTLVAGIDPLTAYLATSPGGADSVAIIAASTDVDVPFVMAMQVMRFMAVLALGPAVSRRMTRRLAARSSGQ